MHEDQNPLPFYHLDDRDLAAFLIYAARERNLDASWRNSATLPNADSHRRAIDALRELNRNMLYRETRRPPRRQL